MADAREKQFQQDIIDSLVSQGWLVGESSHYDRERAIYPDDILNYYKESYPEQWERFCKHYPQNTDQALLTAVSNQLRKNGTLSVLRKGFKDRGARIRLCEFKPDHGMNPDTLARYEANRLRVVPELSYSPHSNDSYNPRLDLTLFVNGIPTATLELKSEFKQSVENAKRQYKHDRPLKDPKTRKEEPLLKFRRGALVHFAVSQHEVWMTTRLDGQRTRFLPFNKGTQDGGAGNPRNLDGYDTAYLWEQVLKPESWLKILDRFMHLQREQAETFEGRRYTKETLIFPRYHQLDAVNQLIDTTKQEGPGQRYLIQHSAGSGKSNSIAWTAHQLSSLHDTNDTKVFDSTIVVTDRTVLDDQLQETIYQFEHNQGVVKPISREEGEGSKSEQLAEALEAGTPIIVVTIQTFPYVLELMQERIGLKGRHFAVIADEAHSSQSGATARKLRSVLGMEPSDADEDVTSEDLMDAAVAARRPSKHINYYAFTATPKGKTLELFGRRPDPSLPESDDNKPEAFHVYSMRQAIEEGFILDVLRQFTSYKTAWKLAHEGDVDEEVDARRASTKIAKWVRLHPYNIGQKVEIIVEHFRDKVRHLLNGQAKAMVVTGSRREAVRYKLALEQFIKTQGYDNVHALVAFSGSVEDEQLPEEVTETSQLMNPELKGRDFRQAFDTDEFNVMIVANKFQTGFDQPKLCAMYVDKKLQGVDCVQTLSRLNRPFPGKSTFVLDFFNDPEEVQKAFEPYYKTAELTGVSDPNQVHELFDKLCDKGIFQWHEVEKFAEAFFDPQGRQHELTKWCRPAVDRWRLSYNEAMTTIRQSNDSVKEAKAHGNDADVQHAEHALKEAKETKDQLDVFKKDLGSFVRFYEFMSQIVDYDDRELEQLCVFTHHLLPLLREEQTPDDDIDLTELELTHYRVTKQHERSIELGEDSDEGGIDPVTAVGQGKGRDYKTEKLSELIDRLNELFGAETTDSDKIRWFENLRERVRENEGVMDQVERNTPEQVMHGDFPRAVTDAVIDNLDAFGKLSNQFLEDSEVAHNVMRLVLMGLTEQQTGQGEQNVCK